MRFLHPTRDEELELATEDVFLNPNYFDGGSRLDTDLSPADFPGGAHPIVSANMNAVTGKRMAETMARFGGLGVLPQDMDLDTVARIVAHIQSADPRYDTPLAVSPRATLRDVLGIIRKRSHDLVVVVDEERRPLGIVTQADLRDRDQYTPASLLMSPRLIALPVGIPNRDAFLHMEEARVKAAPVLDAGGRLAGVLTRDHLGDRGDGLEHAALVTVRGVEHDGGNAHLDQLAGDLGRLRRDADRHRDHQLAVGAERGPQELEAHRVVAGQHAGEAPAGVEHRGRLHPDLLHVQELSLIHI